MAVSRLWFSVSDASPTVRSRPNTRTRVSTRITTQAQAHTTSVAVGMMRPTSMMVSAASTSVTPVCSTSVWRISTLACLVGAVFGAAPVSAPASAMPDRT